MSFPVLLRSSGAFALFASRCLLSGSPPGLSLSLSRRLRLASTRLRTRHCFFPFPLVFHRFWGYFSTHLAISCVSPSLLLQLCKAQRCLVSASPQTPSFSRRHTSRVETPDCVWVCWRCNGTDEVSPVRDLSAGGLFIATPSPRPVGMKAKLDFLVQEGQIRAEAIVRHIELGKGLGLKFTAVTEQDCAHLAALLTRLRNLSRSRGKP